MPWIRANEVSCGSLYPLGSPSKQLSQPARGCFWPLVNPWHPWHTLCLSTPPAHGNEGDNQGTHAIPGRKKLSSCPLQHFIAGLGKAEEGSLHEWVPLLMEPAAEGAICGKGLPGLPVCKCTHLLEVRLPEFAAEPSLQHSEIIPQAVMLKKQNRGREGVSNLPA